MQTQTHSTTSTATVTFHCEYKTTLNEHLHIIGNTPELGNWDESKSPQMYTSQSTYPIWYSPFDITFPIGKTIEYRYFTTSESNFSPSYESLPKRTITMKHPGQFIILNYKDTDTVKLKTISFPTTQLKPKISFDSNSKFISSLKPIELISYENNKMGCDVITDPIDKDNITNEQDESYSNKERVIFESLYLPVNVVKNKEGKYDIIEDENGTVQGMLNCMKMEKPGMFLWVGMLRNYYCYNEDEINEIEELLKEREYYLIHPPSKEEWEKFILFLQKIVFPIFVDSTICHDSIYIDNFDMYFDAFYAVNWKYGDAVKAIMNVSDFIIINDIDLALVPNIITTHQKNAIVGMYIHSPLPASDVIKLFPRYQDIIRSILLCDVIGFHSFNAARNFMTIIKRYFGIFPKISKKGLFYIPLLGRTIIIHIKQAQIDVNFISHIQTETSFTHYKSSWEHIINNKFSVISFDHILLPQSIAIKFQMIDIFLTKYPQLLNNIIFIFWIKEFDDDNDITTNENKNIISKLQTQLYTKYNNNNFIYIEYTKTYNIYKRLSLFQICNVFLYTFYFEGHCIYVNEFISLQSPHKQYGIILSENTTETIRFKSVIQTKIYSANQMALRVKECYDKKEQMLNYKKDYSYLKSHSTMEWVQNFISDLRRVQEHDSKYKIGLGIGLTFQLMRLNSNFKHLTPFKFVEYYSKSKKRILIFDYENTLVNISNDILLNTPYTNHQLSPLRHPHSNHQRVLKLMKNLSQNKNNLIFILSNCEQSTIQKLFSSISDSIGLCAEGGFYYKYPKDVNFKQLLPITDWSWKDTVLSVLKSFSEKTEESFIVEKKSYISWIYKQSDLYFGDIQANEIKTHLSSIFPELSIINDYSSVIIKPANVNKAALVAEILKKEFLEGDVDLISVIGDDYTDEEIFNYLNSARKYFLNFNNNVNVLTATIGSKPSNAEYYFNEINDCIENIEAISQYETNRRIRSSMSCTTLNMLTEKLIGDNNDGNGFELFAENKYYSQEITMFGGEFEFTL